MASPKIPPDLHESPQDTIKVASNSERNAQLTKAAIFTSSPEESWTVITPKLEEEPPTRVLRARKPAPALVVKISPSAVPARKRAVKMPPSPVAQPETIVNSITGRMMVNPRHKDSVQNFHAWHPSMTQPDNAIKDEGEFRHPTPVTSDEEENSDEQQVAEKSRGSEFIP